MGPGPVMGGDVAHRRRTSQSAHLPKIGDAMAAGAVQVRIVTGSLNVESDTGVAIQPPRPKGDSPRPGKCKDASGKAADDRQNRCQLSKRIANPRRAAISSVFRGGDSAVVRSG
jgi:hypothetical protein